MKKSLTLLSLLPLLLSAESTTLFTGDAVVPNDKPYYNYKLKNSDVELLFTKENREFAQRTADIENNLQKVYEKSFDWKLDETLYVGLISDKNQIANGFSTQWPNNRQVNYVGGTQSIDYFCSTSWLDTLLYHETAHNYQINLKGSAFSRGLHSVFGNGVVILPLPLIIPNVADNSFMFEGNAVLNESWHNNGGRLYSGRFIAETALQAKAGNVNAAYLYNSRLGFPYGDIPYIQGGFYNYYIAENYGLDKTNSYFKYHSEDWWWPFRTNASMEDAVGKDFEDTLDIFAKQQKELAIKMTLVEGVHLASSQFFSSLGNSKDEIFFLTNESGVRASELVILDKSNKILTKERRSFLNGKVLKVDNTYYTQGSRKTSPTMITQGLFNDAAFIKEGTESKMLQAYLSDGREVYFDVASSYSEAQLYVGKEFYNQVNSSVIVDEKDNIYYFKQKNKTRTLYKNRTPLFSYQGFYGLVSDVDSKGRVYFVASSEHGSTLYSFYEGVIKRSSRADNIIEARLVNDDEVLLASISGEDYYYTINELKSIDAEPYERKLFFEDKSYYKSSKSEKEVEKLTIDESYHAPLDMHYSGTNLSYGFDSLLGSLGSININFGDPLAQNSANIFLSKDTTGVTTAGVGYESAEYIVDLKLNVYGVVDKDGREYLRDYGFFGSAVLPFYEAGYYRATLGISYFQDYDTSEREPLSTTLSLLRYENHGVSMYANSQHNLKLYGVKEREDLLYGGSYKFRHDLPFEFYVGLEAKYTETDGLTSFLSRGVKLSASALGSDMDPSVIDIKSLGSSLYAKSAGYGGVNIAKVTNLSAYFFTFPISLQRESFYAKYRYYDIKDFGNNKYSVNETTLGCTLSTVYLNSFSVPISFEYIINDATFIQESAKFRFLIGSSF